MPRPKHDDIIGGILLFLLYLVLFAIPWEVKALPYIPSCIIQDALEIRDDGEGKAIVTYYNSIENCSGAANVVITSPEGIAVQVIIDIGGEEEDYREVIQLIPLGDGMMSFPPEGKLLDGERQEFVIMGGVS